MVPFWGPYYNTAPHIWVQGAHNFDNYAYRDCKGMFQFSLQNRKLSPEHFPKGTKVRLWGIPSQTIIVIPNIETLHSTI